MPIVLAGEQQREEQLTLAGQHGTAGVSDMIQVAKRCGDGSRATIRGTAFEARKQKASEGCEARSITLASEHFQDRCFWGFNALADLPMQQRKV